MCSARSWRGIQNSPLPKRSVGTLSKPFPAVLPTITPVSKTMNTCIPVYNADGSLDACASEHRLARLQAARLVARVVRYRKGIINRAILFIRPGEPKPLTASGVMGTAYSFKEHLAHGPAWEMKHLDGSR